MLPRAGVISVPVQGDIALVLLFLCDSKWAKRDRMTPVGVVITADRISMDAGLLPSQPPPASVP
jgi:hypothetical protein